MTIFRIDADALAQTAKNTTTKSLFKDLGKRIAELEPRLKKAVTKCKSLHNDITAALKSTDADSLKLLLSACEGQLEAFKQIENDLNGMQTLLDRIEKDKEYVADNLKALLPLTRGLSSEKKDCAGWIAQLEEDLRQARKSSEEKGKADAQMGKEIAFLGSQMKAYRKELESRGSFLKRAVDDALAAAKSGNRDKFSEGAKTVAENGKKFVETCKEIKTQCSFVSDRFKKSHGPEVMQLPAVKDVAAVQAEAEKASLEATQWMKKVEAAEPKPMDAKRAAKVLSLEKFENELGKLLSGPEGSIEKGLEDLANKAGQKSPSGKAMRAMLVKAKLL